MWHPSILKSHRDYVGLSVFEQIPKHSTLWPLHGEDRNRLNQEQTPPRPLWPTCDSRWPLVPFSPKDIFIKYDKKRLSHTRERSLCPVDAEKSHFCQTRLASGPAASVIRVVFWEITLSELLCICVRQERGRCGWEALSPPVSFSLFSCGPGRERHREKRREKLPRAHLHWPTFHLSLFFHSSFFFPPSLISPVPTAP